MHAHPMRLVGLGVCFTVLLQFGNARGAEQAELVSVRKIWDSGPHNAFTDLIRFRDAWFCTFRESEGHVGGDGRIRVLTSRDGDAWTSAALIAEEGIDLRDPKLSITPEGRLMIVAGGSVYRGTKDLKGRQPRVMFSADGAAWSAPQVVLGEWDWLWRVTWHERRAYGVAYNAKPRFRPEEKSDWGLNLYTSTDGVKFDLVTPLEVPGQPNETTVRILQSGQMLALVRREAGNTRGWIGVSTPPYREWRWKETGLRLGGPNFIELPNGALWAATRSYDDPRSTVLARMTHEALTPVLKLPSGGDTSYAGLVWHDDLLWMSYYSSHEGKSSIYLAKIRLGDD